MQRETPLNDRQFAAAPLSQPPPTPEERERVVQALCLHFAADHIGMESLEARLAYAYAAQTSAQLETLLAELPSLANEKIDAGNVPSFAPPSAVPPRGVVMAILGGVSRKGSWIVPQHLKVVAILGGAEIDLRQGRFGPGVTEIDVTAFMGGVEITVPPGVRVETLGAAIMGGFEADAGDAAALDPAAPVLRVTGLVVMGGVEIRVRRPGKKMLARFEAAMHLAHQIPDDDARGSALLR